MANPYHYKAASIPYHPPIYDLNETPIHQLQTQAQAKPRDDNPSKSTVTRPPKSVVTRPSKSLAKNQSNFQAKTPFKSQSSNLPHSSKTGGKVLPHIASLVFKSIKFSGSKWMDGISNLQSRTKGSIVLNVNSHNDTFSIKFSHKGVSFRFELPANRVMLYNFETRRDHLVVYLEGDPAEQVKFEYCVSAPGRGKKAKYLPMSRAVQDDKAITFFDKFSLDKTFLNTGLVAFYNCQHVDWIDRFWEMIRDVVKEVPIALIDFTREDRVSRNIRDQLGVTDPKDFDNRGGRQSNMVVSNSNPDLDYDLNVEEDDFDWSQPRAAPVDPTVSPGNLDFETYQDDDDDEFEVFVE
ncbi:hypothetical protein AA313_de0204302 [Arthrobotrys entomopaga]|nr:hypothetical protein AA313_de0204302 [Arthrobotrys entomopaga]